MFSIFVIPFPHPDSDLAEEKADKYESYRGAMKCCLMDMPCHAVSELTAVVATCTVQPASQNARIDGGCLYKAFPLNKELLATARCWEIRMNSCSLFFPLVGSACVSEQPHIRALIELSEKGRGGVVSSNSSSMQWKGDMVKGMEGRKWQMGRVLFHCV